MPAPLSAVLALDSLVPDTFRGHLPDPDRPRLFGGQLTAQALMAAGRTVPGERAVHSLHAYFLHRGVAAAPVDYQIRTLRDGRSYSTRAVSACQDGVCVFELVASFQTAATGVAHQLPETTAPPPETLPTSEDVFDAADDRSRAWYATFRGRMPVDVRFVGVPPRVSVARGEAPPPQHRVWLRAADVLPDDPLTQACGLAYLSDIFLLSAALAPHRFSFGDDGVSLASLDHAVWFHAPARADDWLLYDEQAFWADGGRALARGHFFDRNGRLVASVMQEGSIRVVRR